MTTTSAPPSKYRRVMLKLSGEALLGPREHGISPETCDSIAQEIKEVTELDVHLAVVIGGVVDEDADRPHALADLLHRRFERGNIGEIALKKQRRGMGGADLRDEVFGRLDGDIDKGHIGFLLGEGLDHRRADARSAAGDEDDLIDERGVAGEGHGARPYRSG